MTTTPHHEQAAFVSRLNRFVVLARRSSGEQVRAYLPNTARLTDLLVPGAEVILVANEDAARSTAWTVTRVWDGTWVALAANGAADLVAEHLRAGAALPGWPRPTAVRREVSRAGRRFDVEIEREDGRTAVVEVKSLSRAHQRTAPLSATPSTRGVAHLEALGLLAGQGLPTALVFVVQRDDVDRLDVAAEAEVGWVQAVREARARGVDVFAYACHVTLEEVRLARVLPVVDEPG